MIPQISREKYLVARYNILINTIYELHYFFIFKPVNYHYTFSKPLWIHHNTYSRLLIWAVFRPAFSPQTLFPTGLEGHNGTSRTTRFPVFPQYHDVNKRTDERTATGHCRPACTTSFLLFIIIICHSVKLYRYLLVQRRQTGTETVYLIKRPEIKKRCIYIYTYNILYTFI